MMGLTLGAAMLFALVHVVIGRLRFLAVIPRSRWLSMAGGVAVAYVFVHILPELGARHAQMREIQALPDRSVYFVALAGLAVFYGLERAARGSRSERRRQEGQDKAHSHIFWLHAVTFAVYNVLIGYLLLHREESGVWALVTYTVAMALHFVTNDFGMRDDYENAYDRIARWLLAGAVLGGWLIGVFVEIPDMAVGLLFAFLAGGVVLNVLKEELPEERRSRFLPFAGGLAGYAALLALAG